VILFGCVLAAIFAVPICNWLILGKAVFAVVPQNCNMTAVLPAEPFPYATSQFYGELYGMTDLSLQKDWYYSPWILFPGIQGVCPFNPHITVNEFVKDIKDEKN
jgi:hypothetical protein